MEDGKVRNLADSRLKVISPSEQPAVPVSTSGPPNPRLLDQVRQAIRTRHYSPRTEETYVGWIKRFLLSQQTAPSQDFIVRTGTI